MAKNLFWYRQAGTHQKGRPVNGVKADDILADQVQVCGPIFCEQAFCIGITNAGHIGCQRVDPNIHDMARRSRHRNPPVKTGAGYAEIP